MKIHKLLIASAVLLFSSITQASYIVNFAELADGVNNGGGSLSGALGEGGHQPLLYTWGDLKMRIFGMQNPTGKPEDTGSNFQSYAYLDSGNAGLGVCTVLDGNGQCAPSSDDNVSFEEFLKIQFNEAVKVESITINNNHDGGFTSDSRLKIETDIITSSVLDLGNISNTLNNDDLGWALDMANNNWTEAFTLSYLGGTDLYSRHFYLESIEFSTVPTPSILSLFVLGLISLRYFSRNKAS